MLLVKSLCYQLFVLVLVTTGGGRPVRLGLSFCASAAHWVVVLYFRTYKLLLLLL